MLTPMEAVGALVVIVMLARSLWLVMHTAHHTRALSFPHWSHAVERNSQRWPVVKVPARR